jgi:hypothetical protein
MRLLYLFNLFIVCCSSFIIQPAYLPMRFKPSNISYDTKYKNLKLQKKQLMIYNLMNLKKNNKYDNNDDNEEKTRKINNLIVNIIYNIILYSYISYYIATHNI